MAHHRDIIKRTGALAIKATLGLKSINTVRAWSQRNSIPGEYWKALADAGHANLDELAEAAAQGRAQVA